MPDALEDRLATLACWRRPVTLTRLKGGLSNVSYVADDGVDKFVVRYGDDIPVHHVFRDRERAAARAAFEAGLSPEPIHAEAGIAVVRYVAGRVFVEADLLKEIARIVDLLKTCHREVGARVQGAANVFWVFHVIRDYARRLGVEADYLPLADRLEALQVPLPIVFGHHDLLPGNLIDDGTRLWLIDWEYGGFGTAMFDLANLSSNGAFEVPEDGRLLDAYFGGKVDLPLQRAFQAMKAASALREALWALVSQAYHRIEGIDYSAHAKDYFNRFERLKANL